MNGLDVNVRRVAKHEMKATTGVKIVRSAQNAVQSEKTLISGVVVNALSVESPVMRIHLNISGISYTPHGRTRTAAGAIIAV